MRLFSRVKSLLRPTPCADFKIVMPDATYVWAPLSDMTPREAATFALLLHKGANSTREEWATLERHMKPVDSTGENNDAIRSQ